VEVVGLGIMKLRNNSIPSLTVLSMILMFSLIPRPSRPGVNTASDKHSWGEKAWVRGYLMFARFCNSSEKGIPTVYGLHSPLV